MSEDQNQEQEQPAKEKNKGGRPAGSRNKVQRPKYPVFASSFKVEEPYMPGFEEFLKICDVKSMNALVQYFVRHPRLFGDAIAQLMPQVRKVDIAAQQLAEQMSTEELIELADRLRLQADSKRGSAA